MLQSGFLTVSVRLEVIANSCVSNAIVYECRFVHQDDGRKFHNRDQNFNAIDLGPQTQIRIIKIVNNGKHMRVNIKEESTTADVCWTFLTIHALTLSFPGIFKNYLALLWEET
jgi:hypothetical protein